MGSLDMSKCLKNALKNKNMNQNYLDSFQNNSIVYSLNPVKDCVIIMYIWKLLENTHSDIKHINKGVIEKYSHLVNHIIDSTDDVKEVYLMLTQKWFNRKEVINLISYCDFQIILNNQNIGRIVNAFWEGPFETEFFMQSSYTFQKLKKVFVSSNDFLDFTPKTGYKFSVDWLVNRENPTVVNNIPKSKTPNNGHFFNMLVWDKSIKTKFFVEDIFIIVLSIIGFYEATRALEFNTDSIPFAEAISTINTQLSDSTLTTFERETLQASLTYNMDQHEVIIKRFYETINYSLIVSNNPHFYHSSYIYFFL